MTTVIANLDKAVIKKLEPKTKTDGGIILPECSQENACLGTIVSITYYPHDSCNPLFEEGDLVVIKRYSESEIEINNEKYVVVDIENILAKVEN